MLACYSKGNIYKFKHAHMHTGPWWKIPHGPSAHAWKTGPFRYGASLLYVIAGGYAVLSRDSSSHERSKNKDVMCNRYTFEIAWIYFILFYLINKQTVSNFHRGSSVGGKPQTTKPTQKAFLTLVFGSLLVSFWEPFHNVLATFSFSSQSHHCSWNILSTQH